jgi:uvrD/REP helicase
MKQSIKNYMRNIVIAADQLANAMIAGSPDETVSSRVYRGAVLAVHPNRAARMAYRTINALFFWQEDHCRAAYLREKQRAHLPDELQ